MPVAPVAPELGDHLPVPGVRMLQELGDVENRAGRDADFEEALAELDPVHTGEQGLELGGEVGPVPQPVGVVQEARVVRQLRPAELGADPRKGTIVADGEEDLDSPRRVRVVGADVRVGVAGKAWRLSRQQVVRDVRMHEGDARVEQGRVDELAETRAVAFLERHQHPDRGEQAGADVDQRNAGSASALTRACR